MILPQKIIDVLRNAAVSTTITTVAEDGTLYSSPVTVVPSTDGSKLIFGVVWARQTPKNLEWMMQNDLESVIVAQFVQYMAKSAIEGYSIRLKVDKRLSDGAQFDEYKELFFRRFGKDPREIWVLEPVSYKDHSFKHAS